MPIFLICLNCLSYLSNLLEITYDLVQLILFGDINKKNIN